MAWRGNWKLETKDGYGETDDCDENRQTADTSRARGVEIDEPGGGGGGAQIQFARDAYATMCARASGTWWFIARATPRLP